MKQTSVLPRLVDIRLDLAMAQKKKGLDLAMAPINLANPEFVWNWNGQISRVAGGLLASQMVDGSSSVWWWSYLAEQGFHFG